MALLRTHAATAIVVAIVAAVAWFVFRAEPDATWLRVEAPSTIGDGTPFIATVTLLEPADGAFLHVDLHRSDARQGPVRVVATGTQAVAGGQRTFRFPLVLRQPLDVSRAHAVIFLSRSGQWSDAYRVARSDPLPVTTDASRARDGAVRPLPVHDQYDAAAIEVATPALLRAGIVALWLGAAGIAARAWRRSTPAPTASTFVVLCLALAAWEALAAAPWLADHARPLARAAGLYDERRIVQQVATVALVALVSMVGLLVTAGLRRSRQWLPGLAVAAIALYAVVSLAGMLSLHEVDRLLAVGVGPASLADVLRLASAGAATAAAAMPAWKDPGGFT